MANKNKINPADLVNVKHSRQVGEWQSGMNTQNNSRFPCAASFNTACGLGRPGI